MLNIGTYRQSDGQLKLKSRLATNKSLSNNTGYSVVLGIATTNFNCLPLIEFKKLPFLSDEHEMDRQAYRHLKL